MKKYNIGIIGAGMYGKILLGWLQKDGRADVSWVNSASAATAQAAAQEFGVPRWTLDYNEILSDPAVDAVVIATPPYLHAEQLTAALAAGKDVLLEKPLAESAEAAAQILAAVEKAPGRMVLDASCRHTRLTARFRQLKSIIDSGKLGKIYHIHHNNLTHGTFIEWNPNGAWAMNKKLAGGGPFIDLGVYDLSFHLGLLDDVPECLSVHSFTRNDLRDMSKLVAFTDIEQHGAAWLEFSGGLTYYYERGAGAHIDVPNETRLYGTNGSLRWADNHIEFNYTVDGELLKETITVDNTDAPDDGQALTAHFLDCLDGSATPLMPVSRAAKHLDILFKILGR
jgi:predicted dehydrogenase